MKESCYHILQLLRGGSIPRHVSLWYRVRVEAVALLFELNPVPEVLRVERRDRRRREHHAFEAIATSLLHHLGTDSIDPRHLHHHNHSSRTESKRARRKS